MSRGQEAMWSTNIMKDAEFVAIKGADDNLTMHVPGRTNRRWTDWDDIFSRIVLIVHLEGLSGFWDVDVAEQGRLTFECALPVQTVRDISGSVVLTDGMFSWFQHYALGLRRFFPRSCTLRISLRHEPDNCLLDRALVFITIENLTLIRARTRACKDAVLALMKCLQQTPSTPRDVDMLIARILWTTRLEEEWDMPSGGGRSE